MNRWLIILLLIVGCEDTGEPETIERWQCKFDKSREYIAEVNDTDTEFFSDYDPDTVTWCDSNIKQAVCVNWHPSKEECESTCPPDSLYPSRLTIDSIYYNYYIICQLSE